MNGNTFEKAIVKWVFKDNVDSPDADGDNVAVEGDGANATVKWNFIVNANYAANNPKISNSTSGGETKYYGTMTSVESTLFDTEILVYPNPADTYIVVQSTNEIGQLLIVSADGVVVKSQYIQDTKATIDIEDLSAGIYVLKANGIVKMIVKK